MFWPLRRVGVEFHAAQDGKAAADKAFALIGGSRVRSSRDPDGRGARARAYASTRLSVVGRDGPRPGWLSAVIEPGAVTVLTGPNGAGKTTTLQAIVGLTRRRRVG